MRLHEKFDHLSKPRTLLSLGILSIGLISAISGGTAVPITAMVGNEILKKSNTNNEPQTNVIILANEPQ